MATSTDDNDAVWKFRQVLSPFYLETLHWNSIDRNPTEMVIWSDRVCLFSRKTGIALSEDPPKWTDEVIGCAFWAGKPE